MNDSTYMTLMRLLPRSALSSVVGMLTRARAPASMHQVAMRWFARRYQVALEDAEGPVTDYPTFAQFFTRRLKPGSRPVDQTPNVVVSPVDGAVSEAGRVEQGACLQAKGISFPVGQLLGDEAQAARFEGGAYATLYLSPRDYHRIHSPLAGTIDGYTYLPGEFWPVNPASVRNVDALFAVNERLVTWLSTDSGTVAVVAVGATCVSRIHASYDAILTHTGQPAKTHRYQRPIPIERGGELGMFEMGSTVILLFEKGRVKWDPSLQPTSAVRMGTRIGQRA
ncbi:MAG: phosphatidylserine decarboxylase [Archangiaceae bacterium]|nr:phosphatidylserine decarboxylase [Archangiaceae bacterium]